MVFRDDGAVVSLHDFSADGEAESGGFLAARGDGGQAAEILEEPVAFVFRYSRALIAH